MRQVSGCDFCSDTASGTFEVVPPEYDPANDGKRMMLCDHCRDALASVLDPLLDAKSAGDVEPSADEDPDASGRSRSPAETTDDASETDGAAAESTGTEMAATGAGTSSRVPKGYRKVMRFLENRPFPLDRAEAIEMASGAYDLEEETVAVALDHADAHGRLTVSQGEIRES